MTIKSTENKFVGRQTQLRGEELKKYIKGGIIHLHQISKNYTYNQQQLSTLLEVSRVTLNKYRDFIDTVLKDLNASKRIEHGGAQLEQMYIKIERLEQKNKELVKENNALRSNHAEIYECLHMNSAPLSQLVQPIIERESATKGKCTICGSAKKEGTKQRKSNVVSLKGKK